MSDTERRIQSAKQGTNADLFPDILKLYVPEDGLIADVTFGKGNFWKKVCGRHVVCSDIVRRQEPPFGHLQADFNHLPYQAYRFDAVVFDPPYKMTGTKKEPDAYGNVSRGRSTVWATYENGIREAHRVLKRQGVLIVKCMDQVAMHTQNWLHIFVFEQAISHKMKAVDLFILTRKTARPQPHKHQRHAHKNHSFFWVFRKTK